MKPFFNSDTRIEALRRAADIYRGTPWCSNSDAPGLRGGVDCKNYPRGLYVRTGFLTDKFPRVLEKPQAATNSNVMETFLDARPEFVRVEARFENLQGGDLIGLWLGRDVRGHRVSGRWSNHLGVCLGAGLFTHVLMHKHVDFDNINVEPWLRRLISAWRPVES